MFKSWQCIVSKILLFIIILLIFYVITKQSRQETFIDLIENGAIEYAGLNEEGEPIYNFTDKLKDINEIIEKAKEDGRIQGYHDATEQGICPPNKVQIANKKSVKRIE